MLRISQKYDNDVDWIQIYKNEYLDEEVKKTEDKKHKKYIKTHKHKKKNDIRNDNKNIVFSRWT